MRDRELGGGNMWCAYCEEYSEIDCFAKLDIIVTLMIR